MGTEKCLNLIIASDMRVPFTPRKLYILMHFQLLSKENHHYYITRRYNFYWMGIKCQIYFYFISFSIFLLFYVCTNNFICWISSYRGPSCKLLAIRIGMRENYGPSILLLDSSDVFIIKRYSST